MRKFRNPVVSQLLLPLIAMQKPACIEAGFLHWCALLCDYRTENYDDYKQLEYKQGKAFENV